MFSLYPNKTRINLYPNKTRIIFLIDTIMNPVVEFHIYNFYPSYFNFVLVIISGAVVVIVFIVVGGYEYPNSCSVIRMSVILRALWKSAPSPDSTVDAMIISMR